jgi:hypothetical protein
VHLVGFIIRIFHDAQSSECQIWWCPLNGRLNGVMGKLACSGQGYNSFCKNFLCCFIIIATLISNRETDILGAHCSAVCGVGAYNLFNINLI